VERVPPSERTKEAMRALVTEAMRGDLKANDSGAWRNPRLEGRIRELDGVRGLAILLVLVWHYFLTTTHPPPGSWQPYALAPLRVSLTGVDLFFVLSGFLIGGILLDARDAGRYYRTFYLRRIHRIFPLYFVWLGLFFVGLLCVGPAAPRALRLLFNEDVPLWSYCVFVQNFFMSSRRGFGAEWLGITWSLAIEEQFYVLLPLLVRNLTRRGLVWLAAFSILCAPVVRLLLQRAGNEWYGPYTLLPSRADALGFGVLVAAACRHEATWRWLVRYRKWLYAAVLLLGGGVVFVSVRTGGVHIFGLTGIAACYASLLALLIVEPTRIESGLFSSYPLVKLGTVAYGVYLFHQGTNALLHFAMLGTKPSIATWPSLAVTLVSLTVVLVLAGLSWRLLEEPLIRRAHSKYRYTTKSIGGSRRSEPS
jgi:peptidoglycan/LPS O-acetylase OafA/YrhL